MTLRMLSDEQGQFDERQFGQQLIKPQLGAFTAWRQIATDASARIAVAHWNDRNARFIVKDLLAETHPRAQPLSARVVPRYASLVNTQTGCLPYNQDPSGWGSTQDRSWTEWQVVFTCPAIADGHQQLIERRILWLFQVCA